MHEASTGSGSGASSVGIFTAPRSAAPMQPHAVVTLVAGAGIVGDRYANKTGSYSGLCLSARTPGEREPGRQLTLISADAIDTALSLAGYPLPASYGEFRRNVVVRGYTATELLAAQGTELALGANCRVFVHRHCVPCFYNERACGRPGQLRAIFQSSGVSCEILVGGVLSVDDVVKPTPYASPGQNTKQDIGTQPPGYFTIPTERTAAMITGANKQMTETLFAMMRRDPAGAFRPEAAYNSVGLKFWPGGAWRVACARHRRWKFAMILLTAVMAASAAYFARSIGDWGNNVLKKNAFFHSST